MIEDHLYQHVDTDSFPTQRTSDLARTPSACWSASISCSRRASSGICSAAASNSTIRCGDRSPSTYELSSQPSIGVDIVPSYKPKPGHLRILAARDTPQPLSPAPQSCADRATRQSQGVGGLVGGDAIHRHTHDNLALFSRTPLQHPTATIQLNKPPL